MPEFTFAGPYPVTYTETRDALDRHLGTVEPGERREFDEAPDQWWVPAEDPGGGSGGSGGGEGASGDSGDSGGEDASGVPEPEPAPSGPVPAPPAVIPQ